MGRMLILFQSRLSKSLSKSPNYGLYHSFQQFVKQLKTTFWLLF